MRSSLLAAALVLAAASPAAALELSGTVLETIDAGNYTYLRLNTEIGEKWAAVTKTAILKGTKTRVYGDVDMQNFESKVLKRTFDHILFGSLEKPSAGGAKDLGKIAGHDSAAAAADTGPIKVEKAAGDDARTVAQIYAQKAALKGKPVAVRGKIVKVTPEVMGLNWLHIRDGSGTPEAADNDLTVTTKALAKVGQVATIRGTVTLDKDLGGRYKFPVLLENAALVK